MSKAPKVLAETTKLPALGFVYPPTFKELLASSSGSAAGYSAVSSWLTCPEKSRLHSTGVRRRDGESYAKPDELSDLDFGTLCHALRAIRVVEGQDAVERVLQQWRPEIPTVSWAKARFMFRTYESLYPREADTVEYLGVEVEVVTDVNRDLARWREIPDAKPILRTVRYDTVIRIPGVGGAPPELFTFEAKTMSRAGTGSINPYMGQAMTQVALWNGNPGLVQKYGRMAGIIFDCLIKTATPHVERYGPIYFGRVQHRLALEYLAASDDGSVIFGAGLAGHYPRMLHACWGRWRACEYISLCHEGSAGEYVNADGSAYEPGGDL